MGIDLNASTSRAVARFWSVRSRQDKLQGARSGVRDAGGRAAVTGGRQLDGFVQLIQDLLRETGLGDDQIHLRRRTTSLPGFFRPTKEWDIVVVADGKLLATVEFKSQVGPSFGNNYHNRTEEAIGNAHDFWTAYREGAFKNSPRPWLGYLMLLEDCPGSSEPVGVNEPHFEVFPEFKNASYQARYRSLCVKLVRERLYDSACLLLSSASEGFRGGYREVDEEICMARFAASLSARIGAYSRFNS